MWFNECTGLCTVAFRKSWYQKPSWSNSITYQWEIITDTCLVTSRSSCPGLFLTRFRSDLFLLVIHVITLTRQSVERLNFFVSMKLIPYTTYITTLDRRTMRKQLNQAWLLLLTFQHYARKSDVWGKALNFRIIYNASYFVVARELFIH